MNERLNISDLAALLAEYTGKNKKITELFLRELLVVVSDALLEEKIVKIKGFGTFKVVSVEERGSIHINTGERFVIPAHSKLTFTPDKELKEQVNKPFGSFETTELNEGVTFSEEKEEDPKEKPEMVIANEPKLKPGKTEIVPEEHTDVLPPPVSKKRNGTFVFLGLFVAACVIGGIFFFNFNSKKIDHIKDIKQEKMVVVETESDLLEGSSEITPDSTSITDPNVVDTVKTEPKEPVIVKIVPDTRLTLIALKHYGHKVFWVYIYEHNKAIINNPNNIQMGTELIVPDPALYGIDAKNPESVAKAKEKQAELNTLFN